MHRSRRCSTCSAGVKLPLYLTFLAIISTGCQLTIAFNDVEASTSLHQVPEIKVRLLDGVDTHEGILEFFHRQLNDWVAVCGVAIQTEDANVVCRELGFHGADVISNVTRLTGDTNYTALVNIWCDENDQSLEQCDRGGPVDGTRCGQKAARITCLTTRLYGGSEKSSGRVEVWSSGQWGKICSANFGTNEQTVVCNELGYKYRSNRTYSANQFKDSGNSYSWGEVSCAGTEPKLSDCTRDTLAQSGCPNDRNDAVAICTNTKAEPGAPPYLSVRLVDGPCVSEGRLEVWDGSRYETVCQEQITQMDAQVICRQLGFKSVSANVVKCCDSYPGAGAGVSDLFGVLNCTGNEDMIDQCPHPEPGSEKGCNAIRHNNDVGIQCAVCNKHSANIAAITGGVISFTIIIIVIGVVVWYVCCIPKSKYHEAADEGDDVDDIEGPPDDADQILDEDLDEHDLKERNTDEDTDV